MSAQVGGRTPPVAVAHVSVTFGPVAAPWERETAGWTTDEFR